ncbi:MAG: GntR family transcriptional regulator YhfZ [Aerococcaceae bacterium]|nr:GntR family transcriptional regulator YhfZ [Aerococcaceae bacterium]
MMTESFLMKKGQVVRKLSSSLMKLKVDDRLPSISEFQEEFNVSRGTVQNAIEFLKAVGGFEVESKGRLGSYIKEINYSVLQEYALSETIIGTMTLPYSKLYEGFATGIYTVFQEANIPVNIAYIRGAKERIKSVVTRMYKFAVVSKFAAQEAIRKGEPIEMIVEFKDKTYLSEHVLLLRDANEIAIRNKMKIGIDYDSIDQYKLTEKLTQGLEVQFVEINGSQIINALRNGWIDAGIWNIDEIKDKGYNDIHWIKLPDEHHDPSMDTSVIISHKDDDVIRAIFNTRIDKETILKIQQLVVEGTVLPQY